MAIEKATAIVVRLTDYSDTSQIATFVTDGAGVIGAIAKGSKRENSPTGGPLDLLTVNEIVFSTGKSGALATLREAKTIEKFPRLRSLPFYYAGLYFGELAGTLGQGSEGSSAVFDLLLNALRAVQAADADSLLPVILYFESHLLAAAGVAPNITTCARCGRKASESGADARISLEDGGILCPQCPGGVRLSAGGLAALRRIFDSNLRTVRRLRLNAPLLREVSGLLCAAVIQGADRVPRLLKYVKPELKGAWRRWLIRRAPNRLDNESARIYNDKAQTDGG